MRGLGDDWSHLPSLRGGGEGGEGGRGRRVVETKKKKEKKAFNVLNKNVFFLILCSNTTFIFLAIVILRYYTINASINSGTIIYKSVSSKDFGTLSAPALLSITSL